MDESETLLKRMSARDVTLLEVRRYCYLTHTAELGSGLALQPLDIFIVDGDLEMFWWLYDWWLPVADKPMKLPQPRITQFLWASRYAVSVVPQTFNEKLREFYELAVTHCMEAGLDISNPALIQEDVKHKRRDKMKAVRAFRKIDFKNIAPDNLDAALGLEQEVKGIKEEAARQDIRLAEEVKQHQRNMIASAAERKKARSYYKGLILQKRQQIIAMSEKQ